MKHPAKSKTLWVNILIVVSSVLTMLMADDTFKVIVGDNIGYIGTVVGIIGMILRVVTTKPIAMNGGLNKTKTTDEYLKDF